METGLCLLVNPLRSLMGGQSAVMTVICFPFWRVETNEDAKQPVGMNVIRWEFDADERFQPSYAQLSFFT